MTSVSPFLTRGGKNISEWSRHWVIQFNFDGTASIFEVLPSWFKSTDCLQTLQMIFPPPLWVYSALNLKWKIDDVKGWVNNSIGKTRLIFFFKKKSKEFKMYWICPTDIPFMMSHTPMKYYNVPLLFFFFYRKLHSSLFLLKASNTKYTFTLKLKQGTKWEKLGG